MLLRYGLREALSDTQRASSCGTSVSYLCGSGWGESRSG